jgi:amino acid permease
MKKNNTLSVLSVTVGFVFIIIAVIYFIEPAGSLPSFFPGFENGSSHVHFKHGIASVIVALLFFAYTWFQGGKKNSSIQ